MEASRDNPVQQRGKEVMVSEDSMGEEHGKKKKAGAVQGMPNSWKVFSVVVNSSNVHRS